jgi:hypothetical protein
MSAPPVENDPEASSREVIRVVLVVLALVWAALTLVALTHYHVNQPLGEKSVTTNGHTYYGNPPALTLRERDPVSFVVIAITLVLGTVVASVDLVVRRVRRVRGWATGAVVAGADMIVFSLFGLLFGLATMGVAGALLVSAGMMSRRS